ncbi:MAG: cation:proton antiporter [Candidatus Omnitrophica bacterium]|nr:cation:proton antiporter [Candidatus Omnitrophota bacterium]
MMEKFFFDLSVILVGSAAFSFLAVLSKQPIIIAYIICGIIVGPWGFRLVKHAEFIEMISHLGITLLLFLAGLCLHPQKLARLFKATSLITVAHSCVSFVIAFCCGRLFGFGTIDSICIGLAFMFSSTILVIKLLPTTELHHKKMGAICIGVLILQDLLAVTTLAFIRCLDAPQGALISFVLLLIKLSVFIGALVLLEQFVLRRIMMIVNRMHELLFIVGLAWCFGIASISNMMGLFYATGAFFAGVVIARHPISLFISEKLKPLRDFFLVLFFFTLGAQLDLVEMKAIVVPAILISVLFLALKPWLFARFFTLAGEKKEFAQEVGGRLGQFSEFSLLVAMLALELGHVTKSAAQLIKLTTIITFIVSSYIVVFNYPTPIGTSKKLIRD